MIEIFQHLLSNRLHTKYLFDQIINCCYFRYLEIRKILLILIRLSHCPVIFKNIRLRKDIEIVEDLT